MVGNPADAPLLAPAIERIARRFGKAPRAVTADRGYGEAKVDADLAAFGVKTVAIPRKGKPGAARRAADAKAARRPALRSRQRAPWTATCTPKPTSFTVLGSCGYRDPGVPLTDQIGRGGEPGGGPAFSGRST